MTSNYGGTSDADIEMSSLLSRTSIHDYRVDAASTIEDRISIPMKETNYWFMWGFLFMIFLLICTATLSMKQDSTHSTKKWTHSHPYHNWSSYNYSQVDDELWYYYDDYWWYNYYDDYWWYNYYESSRSNDYTWYAYYYYKE